MKQKTVMLLTEAFGGGVETHLKIINENLDEYRLVNVISLRKNYKTKLEPLKITYPNLYIINELSSKNPLIFIQGILKLNNIVKKEKIDLIHAHSTIAGILIWIVKNVLLNNKIKYIYTPHAYYSQKPGNRFKKFVIKVERLICKASTAVIHVSKEEENHAIKNLILTKQKSHVIYNGISKEFAESDYIQNNSKVVFGNLARVDDQKNPQKFFEIAKTIIAQSPIPVEFIYAGEGKLLNTMRQETEKNNLENNIKFIGFIDNKEKFFNKIDCYLSTSYYEGLPYGVIEAMSRKKALFLSNVIGHRELVNGNGLLFDLDESNEKISKLIIEVITNISKLNNFSERSWKIFEEKFTLDNMITSLKAVYYHTL